MPNPDRRHQRARRAAALLLLALCPAFLGFAALLGYETFAVFAAWAAARDWVVTPARVIELDLQAHRRGDARHYDLTCVYTYEFAGETFRGNRVGLGRDGDLVGPWHHDAHNRLKLKRERGEPVACYVDPAQPTNALLFRTPRGHDLWTRLGIIITFGVVGLAFAAGGVRLLIGPGQSGPDPVTGELVLRTGGRGAVLMMWCVAVVWNGLAWVLVPALVADGPAWTWVFALFPVIGAGLVVKALLDTVRHVRFGRSELRLRRAPRLGTVLEGELHLRGAVAEVCSVTQTLSCAVHEGTGDKRRLRTVWETQATVDADEHARDGRAVIVPVRFELPQRAPTAGDAQWRFRAAANVPGVDLRVEFAVPVRGRASRKPVGS